MTDPYILYGMPASLYTAKVRAYLRRRGLPFIERPVGHPRFREAIVPEIGRFIMPVLETPEGELWQDGSAIIDRLEARHVSARPAVPEQPALAVLAHLLALFGGEGLVRPAMHYRWNFDEQNLAFLREDFSAALAPDAQGEARAAVFDGSSGKMRRAAVAFGVTPETIPTVEAAYERFLSLLEAHLAAHPYLLGERPTIADDGFYGPLFAHLGRDPAPAILMKRTAPGVFRWTERMAAPEAQLGDKLFDPHALPGTLRALLAYITDEHVPELLAHVRFAEEWLAERPGLRVGESGVEKRSHRAIGRARVTWRGHEIEVGVMPYRLWLLGRMQEAYDRTQGADREAVDRAFGEAGLAPLLSARTSRPVERQDEMEVWGAPRDQFGVRPGPTGLP